MKNNSVIKALKIHCLKRNLSVEEKHITFVFTSVFYPDLYYIVWGKKMYEYWFFFFFLLMSSLRIWAFDMVDYNIIG